MLNIQESDIESSFTVISGDELHIYITLRRKPYDCTFCGGKMIGYGHKMRKINHPALRQYNGTIHYNAFADLNLKTLWCGYFDGNEKSKRAQEKCGFTYHHTNKDIYWKLMDDIRTEHITMISKEEWRKKNERNIRT